MVTFGNNKLHDSVMICNFTSAVDCPSDKLGLCQCSKHCYAKRIEGFRPHSLAFHYRQEKFYASMSAEMIIGYFVGMITDKLNKKYPVKEIRFSEAGDFESQAMVDKMAAVFKGIKEIFPNMVIYGYSARKDLDFTELQKYATVNGSGYMVSNNFKVMKSDTIDYTKPYCGGDCHNCDLCKVSREITIQVPLNTGKKKK